MSGSLKQQVARGADGSPVEVSPASQDYYLEGWSDVLDYLSDAPDRWRTTSTKDIGERAEAMALARLSMPAKGLAHGAAVARAALCMAEALNSHGAELDMELTHNAALLHDIGKGVPDHETAGAALLDELGLGGLSAVVAAHRDAFPPDYGWITEKEISQRVGRRVL